MNAIKRRRQRLTAEQQEAHEEQIIADFDAAYPVGSRVWYWKALPFGPVLETTVRGGAFIADSGEAVCFIEGVSGCVSVWHVHTIDESRRQDLNFT